MSIRVYGSSPAETEVEAKLRSERRLIVPSLFTAPKGEL